MATKKASGKKKDEKKKVNWGVIKAEYVIGDESCRALAKKYEVSESQIFRHCNKESWQKAREEYRRKVTAEAIASAYTRAVSETSETLGIAKTLIGEVRLALGDPQQLYKRITFDKNGNLTAHVTTKFDSKAAKDMAEVLLKLYPLASAIENPDDKKQINIQLAPSVEEFAV